MEIALGKRLRCCPRVRTLGVQPNVDDYRPAELRLLRQARVVYYPTSLYEDVLLAVGKKVFPRNYYHFIGDKVKQTALFAMLDIPHPRTSIYYGRGSEERILQEYSLPCIAKAPRGSSRGRGVFLIRNRSQLRAYLQRHWPAYIQEYLPIDRDLRVVVYGGKVLHAYWRLAPPGEFRTNVSLGGEICLRQIPAAALDFAAEVARRCRFDEVGLDICELDGQYLVLEANMAYGLKGFSAAGLEIYELLARELPRRADDALPKP